MEQIRLWIRDLKSDKSVSEVTDEIWRALLYDSSLLDDLSNDLRSAGFGRGEVPAKDMLRRLLRSERGYSRVIPQVPSGSPGSGKRR
jgi:hypothetical protein